MRSARFRLVLALTLAAALAPVASAVAQEAPKINLGFQGDAAIIFVYVKSEQSAAFEELMNKFKEGLATVESPDAKAQAAALKLFKAPNGPAPAGATLYVMVADPVVKNVEYAFMAVLYKAFPAEGKALYDKFQEARHTQAPVTWDLTLVTKMQ